MAGSGTSASANAAPARKFAYDTDALADYMEAVRRDMAQTHAAWAFQHIQKTAGTSVVEDLARNCGVKLVNVFMTADDYAHESETTFDEVLERHAEAIRNPATELVTGHFLRRHLDRLEQIRPVRLFTFVRAPVARVVSAYRYYRSPAHPTHTAFARAFPDFMSYVNDPVSQNYMAKCICRDTEAFSDLEDSLARFALIGTAEQFALSFRLLSAFVRKPRFPVIHARKTEATADNAVVVDDEVRRAIWRVNAVDVAIYRRAGETLERLRPQILALEAQAPKVEAPAPARPTRPGKAKATKKKR